MNEVVVSWLVELLGIAVLVCLWVLDHVPGQRVSIRVEVVDLVVGAELALHHVVRRVPS